MEVLIEKPNALAGGTPDKHIMAWRLVVGEAKGLISLSGIGQSHHVSLGPLPREAHCVWEAAGLPGAWCN